MGLFLRDLCKFTTLSQSNSSALGPIKISLISLSRVFGANELRSLFETNVRTENLNSAFAVEGVINSGNLKSFTRASY